MAKGNRTEAGKPGASRMHDGPGGYGNGKWIKETAMKGREMKAQREKR